MTADTKNADRPRVYLAGEPSDPLAAQVFDTIRSRGGPVTTIHRVLAAAPDILEATYNFAIALRKNSKLERSYNELMTLRAAQTEGAGYQFEAHRPMALEAGITEAQIAALPDWRASDLFDAAQRAVLAYADALADRKEVPPEIYEALAGFFDDREVVELTMICGFFSAGARLSCGLAMRPGHDRTAG